MINQVDFEFTKCLPVNVDSKTEEEVVKIVNQKIQEMNFGDLININWN